MHPTFRQVPPKTPCSTMATRLPSNSGVTSELPEPVPMMARSKCGVVTEGQPTVAAPGRLQLDQQHHQGARAVYPLDPGQLDVAGGARAADPGQRPAAGQSLDGV